MSETEVGAREGAEVQVHDTSLVDPDAELAPGVVVGPFSIIGPGVTVGAGTKIGAHVLIERDTTVGSDCQILYGAVLGSDPQDLKYKGEESDLEVGDRTNYPRVRDTEPRYRRVGSYGGRERLPPDGIHARRSRL